MSSHILSFQLIFGSFDPGVQRRIVTNSNHALAIRAADLRVFKNYFYAKYMINESGYKKEPQKGPLSLTNYRTKILKDFDLIKA